MPTAGFEPTIPASEPPQTYALDRAATGIGFCVYPWFFVIIIVLVLFYVTSVEYIKLPQIL
jgi:hypothetical protein